MRMFFLIAGGVFIGLAGLQYNDSNALVWAAMYLVTGAITLARAFRPVPRWLPALAAAACFAGAAWTATHEILNPGCLIGSDVPGPLLCGVLLAVVAWKARVPLGAA
jgi:hypothetical protein